ncbi:MAG: phytoene desaturase family protein [Cyclobacteriaceae bacterium]|jgi:diapolycopene oxygenase|nr:phytoene desaturase family protein [Cytophagales bacterium]MCZ8329432.1 phytoene desaturase family protein [Cyclobacteriaceae bacterium]
MAKAIVIGSGVGGLATAIRLRAKGFQVEVLEKNEYPGGKLSEIQQDGFHFDKGPSLFTQPANFENLFAAANRNFYDYVSVKKLDEANRYFFSDGTVVHAYINLQKFEEEVQHKLKEKPQAITSYLQEAQQLYEGIGKIFLDYPLHRIKTWLQKKIIKALSLVKLSHLFQSVHQYNEKRFRNSKTIQIFNRFATYNGSNPYQAPAMLTMIPHLEQNEGTFYPQGGMITLTQSMYKLATELGVVFKFNTEVKRLHTNKGRVVYAETQNHKIEGDIFVSNMDVFYTYNQLLNRKYKSQQIARLERSTSAVIFYWGVKVTSDALSLHNILFSEDYKKEFEQLFVQKQLPDDPTVYINITSKLDKSHAPADSENWFVMVNAPAKQATVTDEDLKKLKDIILKKIKTFLSIDLQTSIQTEYIWTPQGIDADTHSYLGSLYGSASNDKMAAFMRHANESSEYKNLFFCGGSVHPGGGIPLCLKSAVLVEQLVTEKFSV